MQTFLLSHHKAIRGICLPGHRNKQLNERGILLSYYLSILMCEGPFLGTLIVTLIINTMASWHKFPPSMSIITIFHCLPLYHSKEKLFNPSSTVNWDIRGQKKRLYVREGDEVCPGGATTFLGSRWRYELEYNCKKHLPHQKCPRAPRHI